MCGKPPSSATIDPCSDDGGPPSNLTAFPVGNTSLNVSWQSPLFPNGPIDEYVLNIHDYTGVAVNRLSGDTLSERVDNLKELTEYLVTVQASSEKYGAWSSNSSIYVFTTRQSGKVCASGCCVCLRSRSMCLSQI